MENDETIKSERVDWGRIIVWAAIIGLALGAGLWFWKSSTDTIKDKQMENGSADERVTAENAKTSPLSDNLSETNSQIEMLGDKLSEVAFDLRDQQIDAADQALAEAEQIALKSNDDAQLQQNLLDGIKRIKTNIQSGKNSEAEQEINALLNQLNMPEN